jgi:hypothetical protein
MNFHPRDDFCQNEYSWDTEIIGDEDFHPLDEDFLTMLKILHHSQSSSFGKMEGNFSLIDANMKSENAIN